jgi:uncharacterized protein
MINTNSLSISQVTTDKPGDREFFQTIDGMFFCVTGYLHPPDRYTAYLKYSPDPKGKWKQGKIAYRRELPYYHVRNVSKTLDFLEAQYPDYVTYCPVRGIRFSLIPRHCVDRYFNPRQCLTRILVDPRDPLEKEVCNLVGEIAGCSGVRPDNFGITGSILIGLHNQNWSDIDLLVYGRKNSGAVRRTLAAGDSDGIRKADVEQRKQWCKRVSERFSLTFEEAWGFSLRRWNYGFFQNRYFSIHPVRTDSEITEDYGDHRYRSIGVSRIRAAVHSIDDSMFLPATYGVHQVQVLEGSPEGAEIREIVSYEGLFCDVVDAGRKIEARGKIETVDGRPWRMVIGAAGKNGVGFIKQV